MGFRNRVSVALAAVAVAGGVQAGEVPVVPDFDFFVPVPVTGRPDVGVMQPSPGTVGMPTGGRHATGTVPEVAPTGTSAATGAAVVPPAAALPLAGSRTELLELRQQVLQEMERRAAGG